MCKAQTGGHPTTQLKNCVSAFFQARLEEHNKLETKLWDTVASRAEALSGDLDDDGSDRGSDDWLEIVKKVGDKNDVGFYSTTARERTESWVREVSEKAVGGYFESARLKEVPGAESLEKSLEAVDKWEVEGGAEQLFKSIDKANAAVNEFAMCITDRIRELADTQVKGGSISNTAWDTFLHKACGTGSPTTNVPSTIIKSAMELARGATTRHGQEAMGRAVTKALEFYSKIASDVSRSYRALL